MCRSRLMRATGRSSRRGRGSTRRSASTSTRAGGRWLRRPGHVQRQADASRPTAATASCGTTNVFECPVAGGSCIAIPYTRLGDRGELAAASPSSVAFGDVPINTTATRDVSITVDAGYRTQLASGSGINAPFSFDFDTCGAGGGFAGPGTCNVKQQSPAHGAGPFGGRRTCSSARSRAAAVSRSPTPSPAQGSPPRPLRR